MNMNKPEKKATFIATVRIDIKDLAKLARFLNNRGIYVGTRSKVASEALRIMARGTPDGQNITTTKQAALELEMLGYSETLSQDKRYHNALFSEIEVEEVSEIKQTINEQAVTEYMQAEQEQVNTKVKVQTTLTQMKNTTNSPLALAGSAGLADIDQRSSNEAQTMRAELGQMPTLEVEGDEQNEQDD